MSIEDLAARDRAERARLHAKAIEDVRRAIRLRAEQQGRTDALERQLEQLLTTQLPV